MNNVLNKLKSEVQVAAGVATTQQAAQNDAKSVPAAQLFEPVNLTVASRAAERVYNQMLRGKIPELGLPVYKDSKGSIDQNLSVLVGVLPLVIGNFGATDGWLTAQLPHLGVEENLSIGMKLARFLSKHGVIKPRSEWILRNVSGKIVKYEHHLLTEEVAKIVDNVEVANKFAPLDSPAEGEITRLKGMSELSSHSAQALIALDEVALKFVEETPLMCKRYEKELRATETDLKKLSSKLAETNAVAKAFNERDTKPFYLTHTQDDRGRIYARGGLISTQGSKLQKGVIHFANPRPVDQEEIDIYLGRLAGSKGTSAEAIDRADEAKGIEATTVRARPETAIIRLDGSCNGIQWMSALLNDPMGMLLTNLTGDEPLDLYSFVAEALGFQEREVNGVERTDGGERRRFKKVMSAREQAKRFIMPMSYGAAESTLADALGVEIKSIYTWISAVSKALPIKQYLDHIETEAKYSKEPVYSWTMPDGFVVTYNKEAFDMVKGGNFAFKDYDTQRLDKEAMNRALAPNIIHSIDAYHARRIIMAAPFPIVPIHDSFGCHSYHVKELREIIQHEFQEILKMDVLNSILTQLGFDTVCEPADAELITNPYMFN